VPNTVVATEDGSLYSDSGLHGYLRERVDSFELVERERAPLDDTYDVGYQAAKLLQTRAFQDKTIKTFEDAGTYAVQVEERVAGKWTCTVYAGSYLGALLARFESRSSDAGDSPWASSTPPATATPAIECRK
jgi:hypothetical protein